MSNDTTTQSASAIVPEWFGMVHQAEPAAVADFVDQLPHAKTVSIKEAGTTLEAAISRAWLMPLSVVLEHGDLRVVPPVLGETELYNAVGGTHALFGNFALFWSVRGPGNGPRPRSCFMFYDEAKPENSKRWTRKMLEDVSGMTAAKAAAGISQGSMRDPNLALALDGLLSMHGLKRDQNGEVVRDDEVRSDKRS